MAKDFNIGKLLENVVDEMLEGMQVIDFDWKYLYVNATVAKQAHTTKEALIGKTMMEAFPGIEKTPLFKQMEKVMRKQVSVRMENEFIFPGGEVGWFNLYIHPVQEGIMILSVDITDRKRAEMELNEKIKELDVWLQSTVDRELKMIELKQKITILRQFAPQPIQPPQEL